MNNNDLPRCGAYSTFAGTLNTGVRCERPAGHDGQHHVDHIPEANGLPFDWDRIDVTPGADDMAPAELRDEPYDKSITEIVEGIAATYLGSIPPVAFKGIESVRIAVYEVTRRIRDAMLAREHVHVEARQQNANETAVDALDALAAAIDRVDELGPYPSTSAVRDLRQALLELRQIDADRRAGDDLAASIARVDDNAVLDIDSRLLGCLARQAVTTHTRKGK